MAAAASLQQALSALRITGHPLLDFCHQRVNKKAIDALREKNPAGLGDFAEVNENLAKERYTDVLATVWSERDLAKRLGYLRSKAGEYHIVLLFELALAELESDCTTKTLQAVCLPLMAVAGMRVSQDMTCCKEVAIKILPFQGTFTTIYQVAMQNILKEKKMVVDSSLPASTLLHILDQFGALEKKTDGSPLPSPRWIERAPAEKSDSATILHSPDTWRVTRLAYVRIGIAKSKKPLLELARFE